MQCTVPCLFSYVANYLLRGLCNHRHWKGRMDWRYSNILIIIVNLEYRAGHGHNNIGILNPSFRSFCEFPVVCV